MEIKDKQKNEFENEIAIAGRIETVLNDSFNPSSRATNSRSISTSCGPSRRAEDCSDLPVPGSWQALRPAESFRNTPASSQPPKPVGSSEARGKMGMTMPESTSQRSTKARWVCEQSVDPVDRIGLVSQVS